MRRESKAETKCCQTWTDEPAKVNESTGKRRQEKFADEVSAGGRESEGTDTLDGHFKIIPIQRWQLISGTEPIERHPLCCY